MIRHIVAWNWKSGLSEAEKKEASQKIKEKLEELQLKIAGVIEIKVYISDMDSSHRDIILNSLFENPQSLEAYQVHPEHKQAGAYVGSVTENRICMDYEE